MKARTAAYGILDPLRWTDLLWEAPEVAGDTRFLGDFFLPLHSRLRRGRYLEALELLDRAVASAASAGEQAQALAARGRVRRLLEEPAVAGGDLAEALRREPGCRPARAFAAEARLPGDPEAATEELDALLREDPGNAPWRLWLAYARFLLKDWTGAVRDLDRAHADDPGLATVLVLRGILRERSGDAAGAVADYSEALRRHPRSPGLHTLRAQVRSRCGDREGSERDAHRALLLHPENNDGFMRLLFLRAGLESPRDPRDQQGAMLRAADRVLAEDPRCAWAIAMRGEAIGRRETGSWQASIAELERAAALDPGNAWLRAFLARALSVAAAGEPARLGRALAEADAAVALAPDVGWLRSWRAEIRKLQGDPGAALRDLDQGIAQDPEYRLAYAWRGALRAALGDAAGADRDLTASLELLPRATLRHERALLRWRCGEALGALEELAACVLSSTVFALAYSTDCGLLLFKDETGLFDRPDGTWAPALRGLRRGDAFPPRNTVFALLKRVPGFRIWNPPEPLSPDPTRLEALLGGSRSDALARAWLGRALLGQGSGARAIAELDRAVAGAVPVALLWRAEAFLRAGEHGRAALDLDRLLAAVPGFVPALLGRGLARLATGAREEGTHDILEACRREPAHAHLVRLRTWWDFPSVAAALRDARNPPAGVLA